MSAIVPYATAYLGKRAYSTLNAYTSNKRLRTAAYSTAGRLARYAAGRAASMIQRKWRSRARSKTIRSNRRRATRGYVKKAMYKAMGQQKNRFEQFTLNPGTTDTLYNLNGSNEHILGDIARGTTSYERNARCVYLRGIHIRMEWVNGTDYTGTNINDLPVWGRLMLVSKKHGASNTDGVRLYTSTDRNGDAPFDYSTYPDPGFMKHTAPIDKVSHKVYYQKRWRSAAQAVEAGRAPFNKYVNKLIKFRNKKFTWMTTVGDPTGAGEILPDLRFLFECQKDETNAPAGQLSFYAKFNVTIYYTSN